MPRKRSVNEREVSRPVNVCVMESDKPAARVHFPLSTIRETLGCMLSLSVWPDHLAAVRAKLVHGYVSQFVVFLQVQQNLFIEGTRCCGRREMNGNGRNALNV